MLSPADYTYRFKSNQIFICSNERSQKIDNDSDNEQDSKAKEALKFIKNCA